MRTYISDEDVETVKREMYSCSFLHLIISDRLYLSGKPPSRNDARSYTHGFSWSGCYRIIGEIDISIIGVLLLVCPLLLDRPIYRNARSYLLYGREVLLYVPCYIESTRSHETPFWRVCQESNTLPHPINTRVVHIQ